MIYNKGISNNKYFDSIGGNDERDGDPNQGRV